MYLYRIDREAHDGRSLGPVSDLLGPRLIRKWSEARAIALDTAHKQDCYVHIHRISGGGLIRRVGFATPRGKTVTRVNDRHRIDL